MSPGMRGEKRRRKEEENVLKPADKRKDGCRKEEAKVKCFRVV